MDGHGDVRVAARHAASIRLGQEHDGVPAQRAGTGRAAAGLGRPSADGGGCGRCASEALRRHLRETQEEDHQGAYPRQADRVVQVQRVLAPGRGRDIDTHLLEAPLPTLPDQNLLKN